MCSIFFSHLRAFSRVFSGMYALTLGPAVLGAASSGIEAPTWLTAYSGASKILAVLNPGMVERGRERKPSKSLEVKFELRA